MKRAPTFAAFALWLAAVMPAGAAEYPLAEGQDVIGAPRVIAARYEDTFVKLAREHNVGFEALRRANPGVDAWLPGEGTPIVIPAQFVLPRAPREGIVVNVAELRLYYFPDGPSGRVFTYPISIGRNDWSTPLGVTTVTGKVRNPTWYPPESIRAEHAEMGDPLPRVVPPGPDNPLGKHALRLGLPGYLIHGTNRPAGVGMRVTHGCIRMFPEDIEALFAMVPVGTKVRIVNQPYKLGWAEDGLYLEAHPPLEEVAQNAEWAPATELTRVYVAATETRTTEVAWDVAERLLQEARGIPERISIEPLTVSADSPL
ncbi:MAG TPA: L,D-transpeptidase family protein [Gammaproteobacteria bacterium]